MEDRTFDALLAQLTTRENTTLLVSTVASSASLILVGVSQVNPWGISESAIKFVAFLFPILGIVYRELTILSIDQDDLTDFKELYKWEHLRRYQKKRNKTWPKQARRFIIRLFLIVPSFLWLTVLPVGPDGALALESLLIGLVEVPMFQEYYSKDSKQ